MAEPFRVIVYNPRIAAEFSEVGQARHWLSHKLQDVKRMAERKAPVGRTGLLKASHHQKIIRDGTYSTLGTVSNDAYYAAWVHGGTRTWIYPRKAKVLGPLPFPPRPGRKSKKGQLVFATRVRGQAAQPWLAEAGHRVFSR